MTGPKERAHSVVAAACFFGLVICALIDAVQGLVG